MASTHVPGGGRVRHAQVVAHSGGTVGHGLLFEACAEMSVHYERALVADAGIFNAAGVRLACGARAVTRVMPSMSSAP
nr:hypothetical protein [Maliibacterium massiliense]